ncbi:MAG: Crp/Fnr family transcriptional regulator [Flavobacteriales bacterium]|nr:MAG: Crp/Fnr family transcriptional regulator [Flavobacteriales bacterium]
MGKTIPLAHGFRVVASMVFRSGARSGAFRRSVFNADLRCASEEQRMEIVWRTIERYVGLSPADRDAIAPCWREHAFSRGAYICMVGQVEQYFYIVQTGVQRLSFPHDGNDICVGFAYDGSWSGEYTSFVTRTPARFDVLAMTDSVLWGIRYDDLQRLFRELPVMERFGRLILEELLVGRALREIEQLSMSAEERYDRLVERSPHLLQLASQKDIASYLRMTPETFSRLRRRRS